MLEVSAKPTQNHLTAVKWIPRYLKGTACLSFQKKNVDGNQNSYCDAVWASDVDDRHSTSGAVSCLSKKQATVALSTAEAECVALRTATQVSIWPRSLRADVGVPRPKGPTVIHEDNRDAIAMAKNPFGHANRFRYAIHSGRRSSLTKRH